ncbi:MAG: barstar family protein [Clostridia bacterium]|nr:barstar family protein [Clostridia bacterium]
MKDIRLDITPFQEKKALHQYLKEAMDFPFYYGANLDALYDELSSTTELISITLRYPIAPAGKMVDYLPRLLAVFQDSARENYNLSIRYEQTE